MSKSKVYNQSDGQFNPNELRKMNERMTSKVICINRAVLYELLNEYIKPAGKIKSVAAQKEAIAFFETVKDTDQEETWHAKGYQQLTGFGLM